MPTPIEFDNRRRQIYLDEESYRNTVAQLEAENAIESPQNLPLVDRCRDLQMAALDSWIIFQLRYTAGESLADLANSLDSIVIAYERWIACLDEVPDDDYYPPFIMNDMIDTYVGYLNMVAVAILLRREDLVPRICAFNEGTDFDRVDAVLEELFKLFLPDRPWLDYLLWKKQYKKLLDVVDSDTPEEMAAEMRQHVKKWYTNMKGKAHFWGKHEKIKPEFTPYFGYWAMCSGAFTYLYDIDDSSYRDELVYPKDLVDYARSIPRKTDVL
ncbi:DUF1911 domain-containing protein [Oxalobacteraceae bacterium OTU3CINTB1]|nr:DUF1911 domain-containing protein [Oxalobacteraceae bacterium OTU3CINTB1]